MLLQCIMPQMKLHLVLLHKWNKAMGDRGRDFLIDYSWPIAAFKTEFRIDGGEQNSDFIDLLLLEVIVLSFHPSACVTEASSS